MPSQPSEDLPPLDRFQNRVMVNNDGHTYMWQYDDDDRDNAARNVMDQYHAGQLTAYAAGMLVFLILAVGEEDETD